MGSLNDYLQDSSRIAPEADSNIQQRRLLWYVAHMAREGVSVNLNAADIQLGALELKDANTDNRAAVVNTTPGINDYGLVVRQVGGTGTVQGTQANSDVLSNNPVTSGFRAIDPTSLPTAVSIADLVYGGADEYGRMFVRQADLIHTSDTVGVVGKGIAVSSGMIRARVTNLTKAPQAIKASAGNLYRLWLTNPHATDDSFVCLYDIAAASVTVGTSALYVNKIPVPANSTVLINFEIQPIYFSTALTIAATKLLVDSDTTDVTSNLLASWAYV